MIFQNLSRRFLKTKNIPRFNLVLEGTFHDEMAYSYLQLCGLNVPQDVGIIEEPRRPVISPRIMELTGNIEIDKYEECTQYRLIAVTNDFQSISEPKDGKYRKLQIQHSLCSSPEFRSFNVYIPLPIETCFFACTRDGRIFVNTNYVENGLTGTPDRILPVLGRMKVVLDSKFSHTGKRRHYRELVEALS